MALSHDAGRVVVSVLGAPQLTRDGEPVAFDTRKATALLAYLAVTGRPHRRDSIAALLWPDADEVHARSALRRTLSVLKQGLGDGALTASRDELRLERGPGISVDVHEFLGAAERADLDALVDAATLWRGPFMEGFSLRDSAPFDDWQRAEAARLSRLFGVLLGQLVDALTAAGRLDDAVGYAERWLTLDPLHEPTYRALMRLHAARGDRAAVVRQYRACVRVVDEELGVAPLDETTELYESIARGTTLTGTPGAANAAPAPAPPGLPAALGRYPLAGREAHRRALTAALRPGGVVVVEGEPGVGKTRLVEEVVRTLPPATTSLSVRCYDHGGDVPYGPIVDLLQAAAANPEPAARLAALPAHSLAEAARLVPDLAGASEPSPPGGPGAEARFLDALVRAVSAAAGDASVGATPGVIVVDDAHWADRASQQVLAHLVHRAREEAPCLLFTFRTGEVEEPGPLARAVADHQRRAGGASVRLERLDRDAVEELVAGAAVVAADDLAGIVDDIQRETEGLPFLVVAYLDALVGGGGQPADVGELLRNRLASLSAGAAQVLATASVIGRSFPFDVVRAASGRSEEEAIAALDELVARALIDETGSAAGPEYDFTHGQIRRLVYDQTSLARRRLLHHRVADALVTSGRAAGPAALAVVAHHELEAGRDASAAEHFREAGDLARTVYANREALSHFETALGLGHPDVAGLHEAIGDLETFDGRFAEAVRDYERAASQCERGDVARIEGKLGGVHQRRGDWPTAERHYDAALAVLGPDGPPAARASILADRAITDQRQGHAEQAVAHAAEAMALAEASGDERAVVQARTVAGLLAAARGDGDEARALLQRALELVDRLGDPAGKVAVLNGLARVERAAGHVAVAEAVLIEAIALCSSIGDRHREAALRDLLAQVLHDAGRPDEAMGYLKQAVAIFADIGTEGGSVQTEVWRLSEWVEQVSHPPVTIPERSGARTS